MIIQIISMGLIVMGCYNNIKLDYNCPSNAFKFWTEVSLLSIVGILIIFTISAVLGNWTTSFLDRFDIVEKSWIENIILMILSVMYCSGVSIYHEEKNNEK